MRKASNNCDVKQGICNMLNRIQAERSKSLSSVLFQEPLPKRRREIHLAHRAKSLKPKINIHSTVKVSNQD